MMRGSRRKSNGNLGIIPIGAAFSSKITRTTNTKVRRARDMAPNLTSATLPTQWEMIFLHTMTPSLSLLLCCLLSWVYECVECDSKEQKVGAIGYAHLGPKEDWSRRKWLGKPNNNQIREN